MTDKIEEKKEEVQPVYKPPMPWDQQLERMSTAQLRGEAKKLARNPNKNGAMATVILISLLGGELNPNDPYLLRARSRNKNTYDMYQGRAKKGSNGKA